MFYVLFLQNWRTGGWKRYCGRRVKLVGRGRWHENGRRINTYK
jgi:hypothetical protein